MSLFDRISTRQIFLAVFIICVALIGGGLFLQYAKGLAPCPLCILQRYAFVACGLIALIAAMHNPSLLIQRLYAVLMSLTAIAGGCVSIRQIWLQHNPPPLFGCGPDLDYMVDSFPLAELLPMIFRGEGDCSKVDWTFLTLSIAEWALLWFAFLAVVGVLALFRKTQKPAN